MWLCSYESASVIWVCIYVPSKKKQKKQWDLKTEMSLEKTSPQNVAIQSVNN